MLGVLLVTAGCGSDDSEKKADEPSKAALDCRDEWKDLEGRRRRGGVQDQPLGTRPAVEQHRRGGRALRHLGEGR